MKDQTCGVLMKSFVELKAEVYTYITGRLLMQKKCSV